MAGKPRYFVLLQHLLTAHEPILNLTPNSSDSRRQQMASLPQSLSSVHNNEHQLGLLAWMALGQVLATWPLQSSWVLQTLPTPKSLATLSAHGWVQVTSLGKIIE